MSEYRLYILDKGDVELYHFKLASDRPVPALTPKVTPKYRQMPPDYTDEKRTVGAAISANNDLQRLQLVGYTEEWKLEGFVYDASGKALFTSFNSLKSELVSSAFPTYSFVLRHWDGVAESDIYWLKGSESKHGLQYSEFVATDDDGRWATNFQFSLTLSADFHTAAVTIPDDLDRTYALSNDRGRVTETWTITARGAGAKEYIAYISSTKNVIPQEQPWLDLIPLGHKDIPVPEGYTSSVFTQQVDRETWSATFTKSMPNTGAQNQNAAKKIKGTEFITEKITISGGAPKLGFITMYGDNADPVFAEGKREPVTIQVAVAATCNSPFACGENVRDWADRYPCKVWKGGGYTGVGTSNLPEQLGELDAEGKPTRFRVSMSREYKFTNKQEAITSLFKWAVTRGIGYEYFMDTTRVTARPKPGIMQQPGIGRGFS